MSGASSGTLRNIVVTGTPGIDKSMFGFHLLCLLRCQGETVLFERKDVWYRFSNEGVKQGEYSDFLRVGYLQNDPNSWYLSDPKNQPEEIFAGITVVLVSPEAIRVKEFLKQAKSKRLFMPVLAHGMSAICLPNMPSTDVERDFNDVGVAEQSLI